MSQHWSYWLKCSMMFDCLSFGRRVDADPEQAVDETPAPMVASAIDEDDTPVLAFRMPEHDDEPIVADEGPGEWPGSIAA